MSKKLAAVGLAVVILVLYFSHDQIYGFLVRPRPYFELSASPESVVLCSYKGSTNSTVITARSVNGFDGDLTLKVRLTGLVVVAAIQPIYPANVKLAANGEVHFALTFQVSSGVSPGTYYADVVATSSQFESSVRIVIAVLT